MNHHETAKAFGLLMWLTQAAGVVWLLIGAGLTMLAISERDVTGAEVIAIALFGAIGFIPFYVGGWAMRFKPRFWWLAAFCQRCNQSLGRVRFLDLNRV